jgi:DNA helicase IV
LSTARPAVTPDAGIAAEQTYVSALYSRLDEVRARSVGRLDEALATVPHNPQAVGEREAAVEMYSQRIVALDAAESGLVFGRLDRHDSDTARYIGRIGLFADGADEPLLVDWRAPVAQPFYTATALHDQGIRRRRHIRTRGRTVVSIADETLDLEAAAEGTAERGGLAGESVLLAALNTSRTGRMTDIVRTIQAEQDRIIRADAKGVLVVQGGPGTGKTAVALHRAAYLLYTHRERLARSGLLVVGPSPVFLRYISDVLPSLGETGVVLRDLGSLRPGLTATGSEAPAVAEVKGRLAMADVVKAAVRERQAVLDAPVLLDIDGVPVRFAKADAAKVRSRARAASREHNEARSAAGRAVVELVTAKYADKLGENVLGGANLLNPGDVAALRREVSAEPAVHSLIDRLWPRLTAERVLRDLFASRRRLTAATRGWSEADRELLLRAPNAPWTPADVPLLEEIDELLGIDESSRQEEERERRRRLRHAQETLDQLHGSRSTDFDTEDEAEELSAFDLLDAEGLADRQEERDYRSTAERAAADRTWTYGHVIVDEAQELSAMAWRLLLRRVPTRSMTLVGDVAQTGTLAGASSWAEVLDPHLGKTWRLEELTVNYRTPAEIMDVAAQVLAATGAPAAAAQSVRSTGTRPWAQRVSDSELADAVAEAAVAFDKEEGTLGVLVPRSRLAEVTAAVAARLPGVLDDDRPDAPVVLPPAGAKGLEFDSVLVVDPAAVVAEGVRGWNDLYVLLTRATQRLGVVHSGDLPEELSGLEPRG